MWIFSSSLYNVREHTAQNSRPTVSTVQSAEWSLISNVMNKLEVQRPVVTFICTKAGETDSYHLCFLPGQIDIPQVLLIWSYTVMIKWLSDF